MKLEDANDFVILKIISLAHLSSSHEVQTKFHATFGKSPHNL